jgi:hypothetical protein
MPVPVNEIESSPPETLLALVWICSVAGRLPAAAGANWIVIVHCWPGCKLPAHVLCKGYSTLSVDTPEIVSCEVPGFVSVTICGALVLPTICGENDTVVADALTCGWIAVPDKMITSGAASALSWTLI